MSRRSGFSLFCFVLGLCMGILAGKADGAEARPALVVQDEQAITCDSWGWRDNALATLPELGAKAVRINMLEWRGGCENADDAPAAVRAAGMKPQLTLAGSLPYMKAKARRHRDTVGTYSVWNEPDLGVFRCCKAPFLERAGVGTSTDYRSLYPAAYRTIKREDPTAKVCLGESSPYGMGGWIKRVTKKRGRPLRADCLAIHPYHWFWTPKVNKKYFRTLAAFKRLVGRWARERRLCRPGDFSNPVHRGGEQRTGRSRNRVGSCRPVPIYNTEYGLSIADGQAGDAAAVARAWRYCTKLKFKQCAQYQLYPAFDEKHSPQTWQTSLTDLNCRPTATFYALRRAVTGRRGLARVPWPECPKPTPQTVPLPPKWGTPLLPPLPPSPPPVPVAPVEELPDQPPVVTIPEPVPPLEDPLPPVLPGPPEPAELPSEPEPLPPVEEPAPPVEPPVEPPPVIEEPLP